MDGEYSKQQLLQYLSDALDEYKTLSTQTDRVLAARDQAKQALNSTDRQLHSVGIDLGNVQIEIEHFRMPAYDEDDPEGSMAELEAARDRLAQLQREQARLESEQSRLQSQRQQQAAQLAHVQGQMREIAGHCSDRARAAAGLQKAFEDRAGSKYDPANATMHRAGSYGFAAKGAPQAEAVIQQSANEMRYYAARCGQLIQKYSELSSRLSGDGPEKGERERER